MAEEGFPREVILEQALEERACQVDKQGKSLWEDGDKGQRGQGGGDTSPWGWTSAHLGKQQHQTGLGMWGQPTDRRGDSEAHHPLRFPSVALIWKIPLNGAGDFYACV